MNYEQPDLNLRYSVGLGDIVASILHSKTVSWLTHLITGEKKPCSSCSKRRQALNVIFPIKLWKFYFKSEIDYLKNLTDHYVKSGFHAILDYENKFVSVSKTQIIMDQQVNSNNIKIKEMPTEQSKLELTIDNKPKTEAGYLFLSSSKIELGEYVVKTEYYKKF